MAIDRHTRRDVMVTLRRLVSLRDGNERGGERQRQQGTDQASTRATHENLLCDGRLDRISDRREYNKWPRAGFLAIFYKMTRFYRIDASFRDAAGVPPSKIHRRRRSRDWRRSDRKATGSGHCVSSSVRLSLLNYS